MEYRTDPADLSALELEKNRSPLYKHVAKTYAWLFLGLALTFTTAYSLIATGLVWFVFMVWWLPLALLIGELVLVGFLTSRIAQYSVGKVKAIFIGYSLLSAVTFSAVLLMYQAQSVILAFGVAAVFFGTMAAFGLVTKRDVSGFRWVILAGLIALLVMQLVATIFHLQGLDTVLCFVGLALFMGITTYDAKRTKDYYYLFEGNAQMLDKMAIYSALALYLDFMNIFLYLLRLFGKRK